MGAAQVLDHLEAEAAQAVAVGHDQALNASVDNHIEDAQEMLAAKVQAAADLFNPFVYGPSVRRAELFESPDLIVQVRLLSLRRHACIRSGHSLCRSRPFVNEREMLIGVYAAVARRTLRLETPCRNGG